MDPETAIRRTEVYGLTQDMLDHINSHRDLRVRVPAPRHTIRPYDERGHNIRDIESSTVDFFWQHGQLFVSFGDYTRPAFQNAGKEFP